MNILSWSPQRKFHLLLVLALSLSLTTPVLHGLGYGAPGLWVRVFYTVLVILACGLIHAYPLLAVAPPAVLFLAASFTFWVAPHSLERVYFLLVHPLASGPLFWPMVIMAASTGLFYLLLFGLKKSLPLLFVAGMATFVPLWYLFVDSAYPAAVFYAFCWLLFVSFTRGNRLWDKLEQKEPGQKGSEEVLRRGWLRYSSSVLLAALFLSSILPKGFGPLPWTSLQDWVHNTFPFMSELRGGDQNHTRGDGAEFGLFSFGFQDTTSLGGPLRQDSALLLEVRGRGGVYLKGSVKDVYTGRSWSNTSLAVAMESFPPPTDVLLDYLETVDLRIKHRRLKTKTVFSVLYPREIRGLARQVQGDPNSGLTLPGGIPLGQEYRVRGWRLAYGGDFAALEKDEAGQEEEMQKLDPLLEVSADLPRRVQELALEITGNYQGHYNKIKALESYLRERYPYNTDVPLLPPNRDFVDFFLFDLEEGYCTHFATSLAVMARVAGVPTRYVEGFLVPQESEADGLYPVAGTDAHAWVEGYIPGIGWLPFEATPPFSTADSLPLPRETGVNGVPPAGGEISRPLPLDGGGPPGVDSDYSLPGFPGGSQGKFPLHTYLTAVCLTVFLTAFIVLILIFLFRFHRIKKNMGALQKLNPRLRAAGYYNLALPLLERIDAGKIPGETPREYSRRIIRRVYTFGLDFHQISEGINIALYSGREEIPDTLAQDSEQFFHYIFERYLSKVGKWAAFREIILHNKYFSRISVLEEPGIVSENL